MLWLKSKTQLTIIPNEAPVMKELKPPNIMIKQKVENNQVGKVEKRIFDTSQLQLSQTPHRSHQFVALCGGRGIANLLFT